MSGNDKIFKEAFELIRSKKRILLTTHERPDADGVGCELALKHMFDRLGMEAHIVNDSEFPDLYRFLPGADMVNIYPEGFAGDFDVAISIDAGSRKRLGVVSENLSEDVPLINMDHHISNELFGDVNIVDVDISSSGELVYHFMRANGIEVDLNIATCLYASIVTDTGRFSHENTSPRVHRVTAELLEIGVQPDEMTRRIYGSKRRDVMALQTLSQETLKFSEDGAIAWMHVTNAMHEQTGTSPLDTQDFVDVPKGIRDVKVAVLLREGDTPEFTRVSMRSNNAVDVNLIAGEFGGGGHRRASGCTIEKPMGEAEAALLAVVRKALDAAS